MPENLFAAHELTGNPLFKELAIRYLLDKDFLILFRAAVIHCQGSMLIRMPLRLVQEEKHFWYWGIENIRSLYSRHLDF